MNQGLFQGFLTNCTAKNNEEYKTVLKKRQTSMLLLLLLGITILSVTCALMAQKPDIVPDTCHAGWWFCGLSTGLILGSVLMIVKLRRIMQNETLLKEHRLAETDEREKEITSHAIKRTTAILLITLYLLLLLCSFVEIEALTLLYFLIAEFLFSYILFRKYYSHKM